MSYRRALLRRWSRGDRLAVLVVAVSVGFLTGAGLVGTAAAAELTAAAADLDSPASAAAYGSPGAARAAAGPDDLVLPLARATGPDGDRVTVVGVPAGAAAFAERTGLALPPRPPPGEVRGNADARTVRLRGRDGAVTATATPRTGSALPPRWYVGRPAVVDRLGPTGALVVSPGAGPTPVRGALAFFRAGARSVLRAVWLVTAGAGVLLGVTAFSATRIAVRDRLRTIRIVRATGGRPRTVLAAFAARAGLQTAAGVALGYAIGVAVPNLAVNAAVFAGHQTSLSLRVTPRLAGVLLPAYAGLVGVGAAGGTLAALPAVRRPPGRLTARQARPGRRRRLPERVRPALLDWRALVPTAATLAVFVAFAVLVASTHGVVAPLAGGGGTTITEPGAPHPFASTVPAAYADELRTRGVAASPEILAIGVIDGRPYVARGAAFDAFAEVTGAALLEGRAPAGPGEAVVGADLARTLGVAVGDRVLLGGSTRAAVDRVRVVGTFAAPEPYDDQLVVPLATARRLSGKRAGEVQFVRTAGRPDVPTGTGVAVLAVDAPGRVPAGGTASVRVTLANPTPSARERTVEATLGDASRAATVELAPGERRTVTLELPAGSPRTATLEVAGRTRQVRVVEPDALVISVPGRAPPGSEPRLRVTTAAGEPVAGAAVAVGNRTVRTDGEGYARVPLGDPGRRRVVARAGDRAAAATVAVEAGAPRRPRVSVAVEPAAATPATRPTVRVTVHNPWNATLEPTVAVAGPATESTARLRVEPGGRATAAVELARQPPGTYAVTVAVDGERARRAEYRVRGDPRLAAALASGGRRGPATGIGRALSVVLGNLTLLLGTLLGLAALMTVGAVAAGFASAVHARRRTVGVHRAMGAGPVAVLRLVLRDALLVGGVATALALALAGAALAGLDAAGLLSVYGVRLLSTVEPAVVAAGAAATLAIALAGAGLAAAGLVLAPPARLLAGERTRDGVPGRTPDDASAGAADGPSNGTPDGAPGGTTDEPSSGTPDGAAGGPPEEGPAGTAGEAAGPGNADRRRRR